MPARNDKEVGIAASLDLYMAVAVKYSDKIDKTLRITGIEHNITPEKWSVALAFDVTDSVAAPHPPHPGLTNSMTKAQECRSAGQSVDRGGWLRVLDERVDGHRGGAGRRPPAFTSWARHGSGSPWLDQGWGLPAETSAGNGVPTTRGLMLHRTAGWHHAADGAGSLGAGSPQPDLPVTPRE